MKINHRIKEGWLQDKTDNKQKFVCDNCGQKLWVAPDGKTIYCDNADCGEQLKNN